MTEATLNRQTFTLIIYQSVKIADLEVLLYYSKPVCSGVIPV